MYSPALTPPPPPTLLLTPPPPVHRQKDLLLELLVRPLVDLNNQDGDGCGGHRGDVVRIYYKCCACVSVCACAGVHGEEGGHYRRDSRQVVLLLLIYRLSWGGGAGRTGWRDREREGGKEGGKEEGRKGGRQGGRAGERAGGREGGSKGGMEVVKEG